MSESITLDKLAKSFRCSSTKSARGGTRKPWRPKATIVMLDEMDALLSKQEEVVSELFRLPKVCSSMHHGRFTIYFCLFFVLCFF